MEEITTNENGTDTLSPASEQVFQCPKCPKVFGSKAGLNLHDMRIHGKFRGSPYNYGLGKKPMSDKERLEKRRPYQLALRNKYYREGKNSKGEQMPPGWIPRGRKFPIGKSESNKRWYANKKARERMEELARNDQQANGVKQNQAVQATGDAASAILLAAQVIRAVTAGLKIGGQ